MRLIDADKFGSEVTKWFKLSLDGYMNFGDIANMLNRQPTVTIGVDLAIKQYKREALQEAIDEIEEQICIIDEMMYECDDSDDYDIYEKEKKDLMWAVKIIKKVMNKYV